MTDIRETSALPGPEMLRLFIALEPSSAFRKALMELQRSLIEAGVSGLFAAPRNLHLTLAFIGMWPAPDAVPLPAVEQPFRIRLACVGLFQKAKVLWAGPEASPALDNLARDVYGALSRAGIPFDNKPFVPHITLARKPVLPEGFCPESFSVPPAVMTVRRVCLYRSDRQADGMAYTVVRRGGEKEFLP